MFRAFAAPQIALFLTIAVIVLAGSAGAEPAVPPPALDSLLERPSLDLRLLERAVLERNPSLEAMRSAWRASEASADQAGALDDPMLEATTAPRTIGSNRFDTAYMVMLRQSFPLFGQRGLRSRAARSLARAAGEDYRAVRLDLLRQTRDAFAEYYRNARARDVNRFLMDLISQFRRIALTKYEAGTASLSDVLQADVELAMLDHERVALERDQKVLVARLNTLLRRDPLRPVPEAVAELPLPFTPMRADSALALGRANRPELKRIDEERRARTAELTLSRRGRLPEFMIQARYDRFMMEPERRSQIGAGLSIPIQLGRIGASIREARARLQETESRQAATLYQVEYEVASAAARVEDTHHELEIIEERVVPATEKSLDATRAAYESNRTDFLSLLNAERDLARARLTLYEVRAGYFLALADLERAIGTPPSAAPKEESR
jgi:outer membrane protein, heavy metal efflux system